MSKKESIWRNLLDKGGLSDECVPGQTVLELMGDSRILIENHKRIIEYESDHISVGVCYGAISVLGCNLRLRHMSKGRLMIIGTIQGIQIHRGNRL
jgi:sporulation protein YqfC